MVSWSKSLDAAINTIIYSICWSILGAVIVLIGFIILGKSIFDFTLDSTSIKTDTLQLFVSLLFIVIGSFIPLIGILASFMKTLTELIKEEKA